MKHDWVIINYVRHSVIDTEEVLKSVGVLACVRAEIEDCYNRLKDTGAQAVPEENSGNGHRSSTNASETDKPTSSDGPYSRKRSPGLYSTLFKKLRLPSAGRSRVLDEFDQYLIEKNSSMEHQENPEEKNWTEKQKRLYDVYHQEVTF